MQKSNVLPGSFRKSDMAAEAIVGEFLDTYLYSKYNKISEYKRVDTLIEQYQGIDIYVSVPQKNMDMSKFDEKAAVHYVNKNLPTFAFELSAKRSDNRRVPGWFVNETNETEYYALCWLKALDWKITRVDYITEIEYLVINKEVLRSFIEKDLNEKKVKPGTFPKIVKWMTDPDIAHDKFYPYKDSEYWFILSTKLAERPINVVVRKGLLKSLSEFHLRITPEGVLEL